MADKPRGKRKAKGNIYFSFVLTKCFFSLSDITAFQALFFTNASHKTTLLWQGAEPIAMPGANNLANNQKKKKSFTKTL